jgi:acetyl-CoA acetyltransferase
MTFHPRKAFTKPLAIAGIGNTEVGRLPQFSTLELQAKAGRLALDDAGLAPGDVDAWLCQTPFTRPTFFNAESLAEYMGVDPSVATTVAGGTVAGTLLTQAVSLVESGLSEVAICVFGESANTASRGVTGLPASFSALGDEYELPYGGIPAPIHYALLAQRYLHDYNAPKESFAAVGISERKHAAMTPGAFRQDSLTWESYPETRMVAEPLRVPDCSVITDGGAAFIVTTLERAKSLRQPPIRVLGVGSKTTHWMVAQAPRLQNFGVKDSAAQALGMAGVTIKDIDVAELYDCFSIALLLQLEGLGLCGEGEAGQFAIDGNLELGKARCPVNTDGGLLAYAHLAGMRRVIEACLQLRGEAGERQVADAKLAVTTSIAGWISNHHTMVLAKD